MSSSRGRRLFIRSNSGININTNETQNIKVNNARIDSSLSSFKLRNDSLMQSKMLKTQQSELSKRKIFSLSKPLIKKYCENKKFIQMLREKSGFTPFIDIYTQSQCNNEIRIQNDKFSVDKLMQIEHLEGKNNKINPNLTFITSNLTQNENNAIKRQKNSEDIEYNMKIFKQIFANDLNEADQYNNIRFVAVKELEKSDKQNELKYLNSQHLLPKKRIMNFNMNNSIKKSCLSRNFQSQNKDFDLLMFSQNKLMLKENSSKERHKDKDVHLEKMNRILNYNSKLVKTKVKKIEIRNIVTPMIRIGTENRNDSYKSKHLEKNEFKRKLTFVENKIPKNNYLFIEKSRNKSNSKKNDVFLKTFSKTFRVKKENDGKLFKTLYNAFDKNELKMVFNKAEIKKYEFFHD